ncbi:hypothetical protein [Acetobacter sp.]|uniref:hypothetical protein n=1 Tax=Acetobacter sp. TaxID=440 RepID=UPI0039EC7C58
MKERINSGLEYKAGQQRGEGVWAYAPETSLRGHPFWGEEHEKECSMVFPFE